MKTGEIWLAQLDPTVGGEIQKTRPCVVISPDDMNAHLRTVIVAPMTTGSRPARFRIALTFQGKQGLILLDQVRTLDRARLVKRMGALRPVTLAATPAPACTTTVWPWAMIFLTVSGVAATRVSPVTVSAGTPMCMKMLLCVANICRSRA
jgi:mRNA interferase MazF